MRLLRKQLDWARRRFFDKGKPLEKLFPLYEMQDTILFTPGYVTKNASHVRDALDLKRMMMTVVAAVIPCMLYGMYNTGYQIHHVVAMGGTPVDDWHTTLFNLTGMPMDPANWLACFVHGLIYVLPIFIVVGAAGGLSEVAFSVVRKHEVNEGFLVTWFLLTLILPASMPLWQVALGAIFGVVIGKEIFGGTGMNFLNPALVSRAFVFFAYPAYMSGEVWVPVQYPDGLSGATALATLAESGTLGTGTLVTGTTWMDAFIGRIPGSIGETSLLLCLVGAAILILTQIGSWRIMLGVTLGTLGMSLLLNAVGSTTNPMFGVSFQQHVVYGGWAFGMVFMATDPVSATFTTRGKYIYGAFIGVLVVLIRCVNPAYPEGMMLAILFMNMFAPLIDHFFVRANVKRRLAHYGR